MPPGVLRKTFIIDIIDTIVATPDSPRFVLLSWLRLPSRGSLVLRLVLVSGHPTLLLLLTGLVVSWVSPSSAAQSSPTPRDHEWRSYGADLASTRYAPLDQVNAENFEEPEIAWRLKTDFLGPRPEYMFQSTPLMVGGVVYSTAGTRRAVVALDARTGEMLWMHSEHEGARGEAAPRRYSGRGLSYWSDDVLFFRREETELARSSSAPTTAAHRADLRHGSRLHTLWVSWRQLQLPCGGRADTRPSIVRAIRAPPPCFSSSRHTTRMSRPSGRTDSRKPTACGEVSPTPWWLVTSTVLRRNVASPGSVVTPAVPSGCSCSLVVKEASVPRVMPNEPPHSPPSSTVKSSRTSLTQCGFSPSRRCSESTFSTIASSSVSSPDAPTRRFESL